MSNLPTRCESYSIEDRGGVRWVLEGSYSSPKILQAHHFDHGHQKAIGSPLLYWVARETDESCLLLCPRLQCPAISLLGLAAYKDSHMPVEN